MPLQRELQGTQTDGNERRQETGSIDFSKLLKFSGITFHLCLKQLERSKERCTPLPTTQNFCKAKIFSKDDTPLGSHSNSHFTSYCGTREYDRGLRRYRDTTVTGKKTKGELPTYYVVRVQRRVHTWARR